MNQKTATSPRRAAASLAGRLFAATGAVCLLGPLAGFLFTVYTLSHRFNETVRPDPATASASLDQEVGVALKVTAGGLGPGLLGVLLACTAILVFHFAPSWLRSALRPGGLFWLPAFPIGTVLAVVLFLAAYRQPPVCAQPAAA